MRQGKWASRGRRERRWLLIVATLICQILSGPFASWSAENPAVPLPSLRKAVRPVQPEHSIEPAGEKWALVIGINEYASESKLRYARHDAKRIAETLIEHCGFEKDNVFLMTCDSDAHGYGMLPTRSNLRHKLLMVTDRAEKGDMLFVCFSGHGLNVDGEGYLVPIDGFKRDVEGSMLKMSWVTETIDSCRAAQKILVLDACHAAAKASRTRTSAVELLEEAGRAKSFQTLASCDAREVSSESDELKHGIFSYMLIEGLKGPADQLKGNNDGRITVDEIFNYTNERVRAYTSRQGPEQTPVLKGERRGQVIVAHCERIVRSDEVLKATQAENERLRREIQEMHAQIQRLQQAQSELESLKRQNEEDQQSPVKEMSKKEREAEQERQKELEEAAERIRREAERARLQEEARLRMNRDDGAARKRLEQAKRLEQEAARQAQAARERQEELRKSKRKVFIAPPIGF